MLLIAFISSLPILMESSSNLLHDSFLLCIFGRDLEYVVNNFSKAYFPEFHKRASEFKARYKKEGILSYLQGYNDSTFDAARSSPAILKLSLPARSEWDYHNGLSTLDQIRAKTAVLANGVRQLTMQTPSKRPNRIWCFWG